jgi:hypothetical protein
MLRMRGHIDSKLLVRPLNLAVDPVENVEIRGEIKLAWRTKTNFSAAKTTEEGAAADGA